jgi:hypothetical protein
MQRRWFLKTAFSSVCTLGRVVHLDPFLRLYLRLCCRPPDAIGEHIGLTSRKCQPVEGLALLDEQLRERFRQQVPGWRIQNNAAGALTAGGD